MVRRRPIVIAVIFFTFLLISSEIYLRYAGFWSYPIYDIDNEIQYIPAANQHGRFRNRDAWFFNNRHMGNISNWSPEIHPNLLLIGDSIVLGGDTFNPEDRLGPLLEKDLGGRFTVWSVAANNWSNVNQMTYLDRNADVLHNADAVITEYSEDDLIEPAAWPGYYVYPDHKPWILTGYIFTRSVLYRLRLAQTAFLRYDSTPKGKPDEAQLQRFKELVASVAKDRKMMIFIYPTLKKSAKQIRVAGSDRPNRGSVQNHDGEMRGYSSRTGLGRTSVYKRRRPPDSGRKQNTFINTFESDELNAIMRFSHGAGKIVTTTSASRLFS